MSAPATEPAPAAPARRENVFTHKLGPLPMWAWVAIIGGAFVAWRWYSSSKNAQQAAAQQGTPAQDTGTPSQVPQFVNQTYVSTTAPSTEDTGTAAPPVNPAPVGSSTTPKPTTTLPGAWHYPAPTGLHITNNSGKGVHLAWTAVTGPSGQHPNTYTVATFDSKNKLVNQHSTLGGNTNTAEYGRSGKGLPKGTYHTQVWANGGPVSPPHSSVSYTLKS
ncbi:MAG TPA: hypothetical protein VEH31_12115 [Streptosporangiaceae bacterium]|nr:hypothetical protein [Streptosporangiaceae bacterium]